MVTALCLVVIRWCCVDPFAVDGAPPINGEPMCDVRKVTRKAIYRMCLNRGLQCDHEPKQKAKGPKSSMKAKASESPLAGWSR